jgi:hypothetical protein
LINYPGEETFGEEFSAFRDIFRANNYPARNTPSEEYSKQRIFRAKHSAKNFLPSGIFFERIIIRQGILLAKNTPSKESSGRRILRRGIFRPNKKITVAKNSPAKNHPSEELSGEELPGEEFS